MIAAEMLSLVDVAPLFASDEQAVVQLAQQVQGFSVAAFCVSPEYLALAKRHLPDGVRLAVVIDYLPEAADLPMLLNKVAQALQAGAVEVELLLPYRALQADELQAVKHLCLAHQAKLKLILQTEGWTTEQLSATVKLAIAGGADYLQVSTLEAVEIVCQCIQAENAAERVGIKFANDAAIQAQAAQVLALIARYFGQVWICSDRVRIAGVALFADLCRAEIVARAQAWLAQDPDAQTQAEVQTLLAAEDNEALAQRFARRLQFGTAGLRGRLQAGSNGMNRVLVAQTAKGIADYLLAQSAVPSIVIGYDARHNSQLFAEDSAAILQGAGVKTYLLPKALPTPVLAYAVRALQASAGIMVTASHNPPQDNGYKVYLGGADGGAQIVAPADKEIAACIAAALRQDIRTYPRSEDYQRLDEDLWQAYCQRTAALANQAALPLNYVYSAMHGVGAETFLRCLQLAAYPLPHMVAEQARPNPDFPSVRFPNPEEEGALDLAIQAAVQQDAELILAHDPDADRLAVAIKQEGKWQRLHGNTIGYWLAWEAAQAAQAAGNTGCFASSLVSGPLLGKIAAAYGLDYVCTLTGFKWIGRVPNLLFGYEEALGYLVDADKVHDKDGISAAMAFLNLALKLKRQGKSFADYAQDFEAQFGAYASGQVSVRKKDSLMIEAMMQAIRSSPPAQLAGIAVQEVLDYQTSALNTNILSLRVMSADGEARVLFRPSGTEPKLKIYIDTIAAHQAAAEQLLAQIEAEIEKLYSWI